MLVAYLVEALWFPGQTFSNGQFSCRVAPLYLLGLDVWAWIVVATLFQTCFRPPKKWMHGAGESACAFGSCPQKPPNGLDAIEDMEAAWCVSTPIDLSIYLSIFLSVSINMIFSFYSTYFFKDRYIKYIFQFKYIGPLLCNQSPVSISNSVPFGTQFGTLNCGRNGTKLHRLLQII